MTVVLYCDVGKMMATMIIQLFQPGVMLQAQLGQRLEVNINKVEGLQEWLDRNERLMAVGDLQIRKAWRREESWKRCFMAVSVIS